jgi:MYXO-CTERM domain-containing protein
MAQPAPSRDQFGAVGRRASRMLWLAIFSTLSLVPSRPAGAYVRTVTDRLIAVHWPRSCVLLTVHSANPPPNLSPELVLSAATAAAAAWSTPDVACTSWVLAIVNEATADATAANDKKNNLVFRQQGWSYDPSALAITTVFAQQTDGVIVDADVEVNATAERFRWGDLVAGVGTGGGAEDLQNTLTHEFGHLLGLDHNCLFPGSPARTLDNAGQAVPACGQASPEIQESTMFPAVSRGDVLRRTLAADDVAAVCAIYPVSQTVSCFPDAAAPADDAGGPVFPGDMKGVDAGADENTAMDSTGIGQSPVMGSPQGCSCGVGGRSAPAGGLLLGLLALALSWRRRRENQFR